MRRSSFSLRKKRAAHFAELPDFLPERFFGHTEMRGEAGKAHKLNRAAVDQLFCQRAFIGYQGTAANMTDRRMNGGLIFGFRVIHGFLPAGTDKASYRGREPPD